MSAAKWKDRRAADTPVVVSAQASRLRQALELARDNGADLAIIDTPGKSDNVATKPPAPSVWWGGLIKGPVHR
jgi:chromosome partitioning protein